ncbi:MAG: flavodoxin [Clostridia bacterium]|nr:flavodoxin [Clostridia bacterium]
MSKSIVVFQSKYGSTKRYAHWIAEELSCDLAERKNLKAEDLKSYDTIIYGGGLYAGGVAGFDLITKNFDKIADKNLILFTCGLADPSDQSNTDSIKEGLKKVMTSQMQEKIKVFHLRGAMDYTKLSFPHKSMMALLHKMVNKRSADTLRSEDKEMLATYGENVDFTDQATVKPLIDYVNHISTCS